MLAFLALLMITISSLNQIRGQMNAYDGLVRSEFEIMANAATIERMEIINLGTDWDDLDALNGDSTSISYTVGATTVPFSVQTAVQYVDVNGVPSGFPTSYKEVVLTASHPKFNTFLVTHVLIFAE